MTTQSLKPCPFCGSPAEVEAYEPCNDYPSNALYSWDAICSCTKCMVTGPSTSQQYKSKEEAVSNAIEKWNQRIGV